MIQRPDGREAKVLNLKKSKCIRLWQKYILDCTESNDKSNHKQTWKQTTLFFIDFAKQNVKSHIRGLFKKKKILLFSGYLQMLTLGL